MSLSKKTITSESMILTAKEELERLRKLVPKGEVASFCGIPVFQLDREELETLLLAITTGRLKGPSR